jgi:hypothetical protein
VASSLGQAPLTDRSCCTHLELTTDSLTGGNGAATRVWRLGRGVFDSERVCTGNECSVTWAGTPSR